MKRLRQLTLAALFGLVGLSANAAIITFVVPMSGAQEAPGPGDPDGFGTATLMINDVALTIDWNIVVGNIDLPLTGAHIHLAPAGVAGPVVVNFNSQLSGTGLSDPDLAAVLANPAGFYVNVHNQVFPAGAIRGQLVPEPGALALLGLAFGALALARGRRRGGRAT